MRHGLGLIVAMAGVLAAGSTQAAYLTNGDFELWTSSAPDGWSVLGNGIGKQTSPTIAGSHSAKVISTNGGTGSLSQTLADQSQLTKWSVSFDLATSDPSANGDTVSGERSFDLTLSAASGGALRLRIIDIAGSNLGGNGIGEIQTLISTTWTTRMTDVFTFSTANTAAGLKVNHIVVSGDYSEAGPTYAISVTNAFGATQTTLPLANFVGAAPTLDSPLSKITLTTNNLHVNGAGKTAVNSYAIVDNFQVVSVPEPITGSILASLASLMLMGRRRQR